MSATSDTPAPSTKPGYHRAKRPTTIRRNRAIVALWNREFAKGYRPEIVAAKVAKAFYLSESYIYRVVAATR